MIISIIMIIAIVGIATYVIVHFIGLGKATQLGLFYQDFQDSVDDVWNSAITNKVFSFNLPTEIKSVCFGDLNGRGFDTKYEEEYEELKEFSSGFDRENKNMFLYPVGKADEFAYLNVEHVDLSGIENGFSCFDVRSGKVEIRLEKAEYDSEVRVGGK